MARQRVGADPDVGGLLLAAGRRVPVGVAQSAAVWSPRDGCLRDIANIRVRVRRLLSPRQILGRMVGKTPELESAEAVVAVDVLTSDRRVGREPQTTVVVVPVPQRRQRGRARGERFVLEAQHRRVVRADIRHPVTERRGRQRAGFVVSVRRPDGDNALIRRVAVDLRDVAVRVVRRLDEEVGSALGRWIAQLAGAAEGVVLVNHGPRGHR